MPRVGSLLNWTLARFAEWKLPMRVDHGPRGSVIVTLTDGRTVPFCTMASVESFLLGYAEGLRALTRIEQGDVIVPPRLTKRDDEY